LITRLEKSYLLWRVVASDLETLRMRRPCPTLGHSNTVKNPVFCLSAARKTCNKSSLPFSWAQN
jgi:hypothetical protein